MPIIENLKNLFKNETEESSPAETAPVVAHVVDEKPAETAPVVAPVVDEKPAETAPVVDEKPAETAPVVDEKPAETESDAEWRARIDTRLRLQALAEDRRRIVARKETFDGESIFVYVTRTDLFPLLKQNYVVEESIVFENEECAVLRSKKG